MGLLSNFCFFAELLGILRPLLFAMSLPMSLYIPSPKTMEETRSFFSQRNTHTHTKWCCFVVFKETTREVFQVLDIQFESQKRTCSDDNKEIFGIKTADEPDRFRVVCLNIGRSMSNVFT